MAHLGTGHPQMAKPLIAHINAEGWLEHSRFPGITVKPLLRV